MNSIPYDCEDCGANGKVLYQRKFPPKYCPHCGAKHTEKKDDNRK